ncbi:MAG TPA: hypothetical protein P5556_08780, partial [Candidatus Gastranaerophilales bacterium]|nr:hypothetical protein [Candidatus Gastranaerophilales bacterium]
LRSKRKENEETASILLHAGKTLKQVQGDTFNGVKQLIFKLSKKYYKYFSHSLKWYIEYC